MTVASYIESIVQAGVWDTLGRGFAAPFGEQSLCVAHHGFHALYAV
jgi:hypothetical protein